MSSEDSPPPGPEPVRTGRIAHTFGGYEVVSELGRGGMGIVYKARQLKLNRTVALKVLTGHFGNEELSRFSAEAEMVAQLHHANIVHIYEVGDEGGTPFFSMEHIEGGSLADRLRICEFKAREAAALMLPIARAVHFAHEHGVIHRDLKPANVLLDADGIPKVVDFGIAKRLREELSLTLSGVVVGTPTYMAPEQAKGNSRDVGPATDVYSLGAILYELLTGRPPFLPDESETALTIRVVMEDPVSPAWHRPDVPRELEAICMMCLQKEPRHRYGSAAALADDLRRYLDDEPIVARPPTRIHRTAKWVRRHPWRTVLYSGLLVLLGAVVTGLWQWEYYQRSQVIYASGIDLTHERLVPVGEVGRSEVARRAVTLKFTRQGRAGRIVRIDAVNPSEHPAVSRRIFGTDLFPNWLEGATGAQALSERTREANAMVFGYAGDRVSDVRGLDRNGQVIWHLQYFPVPGDDRLSRVRFANMRGYDFKVAQGASHAELERNELRWVVRASFFDSSGRQAANGEEVYGYQLERDTEGRLTRLVNTDKNGYPMANRVGVVGLRWRWDSAARTTTMEYRDASDRPMLLYGVAATKDYRDAAGNFLRQENLDAEGELVNSRSLGTAVLTHVRNSRGEAVEISLIRLQTNGELVPKARTFLTYDGNGYVTEMKVVSENPWRRSFKNDEAGNIVEEQYLDMEGRPSLGPDGWSLARYSRKFAGSPQRWREEESYFGANGEKAWSESGRHHRRIDEFDLDGRLVKKVNEDHSPASGLSFRYVSEPEFDAKGRLVRTYARFEQEDGSPFKGVGVFSGIETEFDEEGRSIRHWQTGNDVASSGAPIWLTETTWGPGSLRVKEVLQACGEDRKALQTTLTGTPARVEKNFDEFGESLARLLEKGFNEEAVGFFEREQSTDLQTGKIQVIRRRKDGSTVPQDQVKVRIRAILEGAPETTKRLRVGDLLLSVNGQPVTSMFMFGNGKGADGGAVEILRDGQRLVFDAFTPGPLGVLMEELAK